ncbi:right-handed parallel beta-helix repeat-containing protein [Mariniflexile soesokkakense]|uniref:Right-handed parallel beta-helix repeat-containing protein n=1 Tax=Mariniflexile soesokkakense TaxID=1343160 RepID=A0ABV0ABE1_9FLAO
MAHKTLIIILFLNVFFVFPIENPLSKSNHNIETTASVSNSAVADFVVSTPQELTNALAAITAGGNIFIREGNYVFTSRISISKSGTSSNLISILPHPDNTGRAKLDFSSMAENSSNRAITLSGSYWHIKGIDIFGAGDNGMFIGGSNNLIEFCTFSECKDSGLQIGSGGSNNTILNCDSFNNADSSIENADGFACKLDAGTGNKFIGCRAWQNLDDGWDGYLRPADNITTTHENCWAFRNGYLKNGTIGGGDGNGFKTGGSDDKLLKHNAIYKNCIAAGNVFDGFDHNSNRGDVTLYNCSAYSNGRNINFSSTNIANSLTIKNTISISGVSGGDSYSATTTNITNNSWQNGLVANASDFVSLDMTLLTAPRKADGSLPDIDFMKLVPDSDLIDKGVDVGLAFNGAAPDLGAFESVALGMDDFVVEQGVFNYPNPFSTETHVVFHTKETSKIGVSIYNLMGVNVFNIAEKTYPAGKNSILLDRNKLASGNYLLVIKGRDHQRNSKLITIQ